MPGFKSEKIKAKIILCCGSVSSLMPVYGTVSGLKIFKEKEIQPNSEF
jgi:hypothetical protein